MVKVDIISGFLGAGKTTLIKKLFSSAFKGEKVALIENEFGEIGIDGAFLKDTGVNIKEINSGCICCSLSGNFKDALKELISTYDLDRIIIEPSGVGKLSEVISAVEGVDGVKVNVLCTVVDGNKIKLYHKNFGEFYIDQIINANSIVLSKTEGFSEQKLIETCEYIKNYNPTATIITTPVKELDGGVLLENLEDGEALMAFVINALKKDPANHHHHHEHHDHDCHCEHDHEHHDPACPCGCHHHHDADEIFDSFYMQSPIKYTKSELELKLQSLDSNLFGEVLRAKGIVSGTGGWFEFDYVPGVVEIREGSPNACGKICVIGTHLDKDKLKELFSN